MKGTSFSQASRETILKEKDQFLQGFHCFLNYWELKPSALANKLQELALHKIDRIATFVPWAHFENDIHHSLSKFLRAAIQANIKIELLVLPELGVNYPYCGIPKELLKNSSNLVQDRSGQVVNNCSAPHIFPLLSFSSPEVLKSFGNFLLKLSGLLLESQKEYLSLGKTGPFCDILISSAFSNYLRNATLSEKDHGDFSVSQVLAFKEFLSREYKTDPRAQASESVDVFKTSIYESLNRHRYIKFTEDQLVEKTQMIFARKLSSVRIKHIDLINIEARPEHSALHLLSETLQYPPAFELFFESIMRAGEKGEIPHFSNNGVFRRLGLKEKAFLLQFAESYCGTVFMHVEDYLELRGNFVLEKSSQEKVFTNIQKNHQVTYVAPSKYYRHEPSYGALKLASGPHFSAQSDLGYHRSHEERLVFIDPKSVLRLVDLVQALSIAQKGKVVALPAPIKASEEARVLNYLPDAFHHLEKFQHQSRPLKIKTGLTYDVNECGLGYIIFYDAGSAWFSDSVLSIGNHWLSFFQAILGLAEFRNFCKVTNSELQIQVNSHQDDTCMQNVFIFNPTPKEQLANVLFNYDVVISEQAFVGKNIEVTLKPFEILTLFCKEASMSDLTLTGHALTDRSQADGQRYEAELRARSEGETHGS